jgi:phospholipase C
VVYIVNEGRTYDQVLGDLKSGNGEVTLAEFGEKVTPNQHRLAREYVLLDHFYASGDTSADGESWAVAGIAPDFVQKLLAARRATNFGPNEPGAVPPAGYLWTNARSAGVSFKDYPRAGSDLEQARLVLQDLAEFEKTGQMPRLLLVRLGASSAADNDRALGMLVDGITKSSFWPTTAVLVSAASAGSGPDHFDPHRAPAFVVSPYARRGVLDGNMYNTTSMLRTVELILGLQPMTQFDAAARPLSACFQARPATAR